MKSKSLQAELDEYKEVLGVDLYTRLCRRINGNIVQEKRQSDSVLAVQDGVLPYVKGSLVEIPQNMLDNWDWYQDQLQTWHLLEHPYLWSFDGLVEFEGKRYLRGERLQGTPLSLYSTAFKASEAIVFLEQSLSYLEFLHHSGMMIGGMCPERIFWSEKVQFLDIGSQYLLALHNHMPGMPLNLEWEYQPPEVFMTAQVSASADIYALGLITWEAILGKRFHKGDSLGEMMQWHQHFYPKKLHGDKLNIPEALSSLLEGLCNKNIEYRTTISEALAIITDLKREYVRDQPAPATILASKVCMEVQHATLEMVRIPSGSYIRGGADPDGFVDSDDLPAHSVTLRSSFLISTTPVTQELYEVVVGQNPSKYKKGSRPVETISWYDACLFCNLLSMRQGLQPHYRIPSGDAPQIEAIADSSGFRLPTEAEWEYAARAGRDAKYAGGDDLDVLGHYEVNRRYFGPIAVCSYQPNDWGIYDMSGNVLEWCWDGYDEYPDKPVVDPDGSSDEDYKIVRGGSWNRGQAEARIRKRKWMHAASDVDYLGFRIVRTV
ncbi:MAG: SUMF1/EgtB/PvdO family nonheme iron enzyme [Myxococcota bacterium]|nr:SUMF1/EgtB/PvdO family nonheme iron enzyme [Myxococcota bacterium]